MTRLDSEVSSAAGDSPYKLKALQTAREVALTCNAVVTESGFGTYSAHQPSDQGSESNRRAP
jgi:hypothetical protein